MNKQTLRKTYLNKRKALNPEELEKMNLLILEQMNSLVGLLQSKTVSIFLSIPHQNEPDTQRILDLFWSENIETCVPRIKDTPPLMELVSFNRNSPVAVNQYKIPEPTEGRIYAENEIDLVFIPLLVFDRNGNRIGYGKGYYDHFLEKCRKDTLKIGLSFESPIEKIPDVEPHDIPLNYCITPNKVYRFTS